MKTKSFLSGLLFAIGLGVAGMTDPGKVIGFLDLFGRWNASLALVMAGAIAVHLPVLRLGAKPRSAASAARIDRPLLLGAALFGVGWGLAGYCPGSAVVALAGGRPAVSVFVVAMLVGSLIASRVVASREPACG
jgi:uncharacterized membrane protein YedE/YeeE